VDPVRVAAIGYCFGGSTVQALAYTGAPLAGVVSFHGGLIPVPADAAAKTKAKLLICHGAADGFISAESLAAFTKAMNDGKFDYQFISYAGAVHAFTNPKADEIAKKAGLPIAYHPVADKRSWGHMRQFFREILGERK
jgi:dienelactone hydrolase